MTIIEDDVLRVLSHMSSAKAMCDYSSSLYGPRGSCVNCAEDNRMFGGMKKIAVKYGLKDDYGCRFRVCPVGLAVAERCIDLLDELGNPIEYEGVKEFAEELAKNSILKNKKEFDPQSNFKKIHALQIVLNNAKALELMKEYKTGLEILV